MADVTGSVVATTIQGSVGAATIHGAVSAGAIISDALVGGITIIDYDVHSYDGDYTITPTTEEQTLPVQNLRMRENLTINPIPQNYGLITWNGSILTVS